MTVTAAQGFRAAGVAAGLKSAGPSGAGGAAPLDVALVVNDGPAAAAVGVFTRNRVRAAPVLWSQQVLAGGVVRAVVLNSGCANAGTGPAGFQDTHSTAEHVAAALGIGAGEVAVCSTGLIGERLPMHRLLPGIDTAAAALSRDGGPAAAEAILTTDTRPKTVALEVDIGSGCTVGGMAKGAGMIAPSLATLLVVLTTDAVADLASLTAALRSAVRVSFERLDVDGCLSTNDTVLLLANGASGVAPDPGRLAGAVTGACEDLVQQLLADAEGATKRVAIGVSGAVSEDDAVTVGRAVARSNLVKTALFGNDPNWGRILAAVGTTSAIFSPDRVDVAVNGQWVCRNGAAAEGAKVDLAGPNVMVQIVLHAGQAAATVWTTDLSTAYVQINAEYPT